MSRRSSRLRHQARRKRRYGPWSRTKRRAAAAAKLLKTRELPVDWTAGTVSGRWSSAAPNMQNIPRGALYIDKQRTTVPATSITIAWDEE